MKSFLGGNIVYGYLEAERSMAWFSKQCNKVPWGKDMQIDKGSLFSENFMLNTVEIQELKCMQTPMLVDAKAEKLEISMKLNNEGCISDILS